MKPVLNIVKLESIAIFEQLQWEEALLRIDKRNWCILNLGSPPAIVMGISGKLEQLIHQEKLKQFPIPLIKRFSGGGTVVIDQNTLFVTIICQADALPISPFPRSIMEWTAGLYRPLFPQHSFQLQENDYAIGTQKWGGNAQSLIKGRWLHHSSILWDYCLEYMDYLLIPPKAPHYRQGRHHHDFLCRLKDYWPDPLVFQNQFIEELKHYFHLIEFERDEIQHVATQEHRKVTCLI